MRATRLCALIVLVSLALAAAAGAQQHPLEARGFAADKAYAIGDVDSVNLFSGALAVKIPIGPSYPVGGKLSYQLGIYYNGNLWQLNADSNQPWTGDPNSDAIVATPSTEFNCGLGWNFHFGRLFAPIPASPGENDTDKWVYLSPDGARHSFYSRLHENVAAEQSSGTQYSRDGSYLRLKTGTTKTVEFPDGTVHEFAQSGFQGRTGYFLTKIHDRLGNSVSVSYNTSTNLQATATDSFGRTQTIKYVDKGTAIDGARYYVDQILLKGFSGTQTWNFGYAQRTIDRTTLDSWWGNNSPVGDPLGADPVTVILLTSINGPVSLTWNLNEGGSPSYDLGDPAAPRDAQSGLLKSLRTPTKGWMRWTWQDWQFKGSKESFRKKTQGIETRQMDDAIGGNNGVWTYTQENYPPLSSTPTESHVKVVDPEGNFTKHYFEIEEFNGVSDWTYSLPVICRIQSNGLCLTRELYEQGSSSPARSWYVGYDHDALPSGGESEDQWNTNRRVNAERTVFNDDTGWVQHDYSSFDGYGHYRTDQHQGSFGTVETRTLETNYNPGTGTYQGSFTPLGISTPWVLNTYSHAQQIENGATDRREFSFNTANGLLTCERTLKNGSGRATTDVLVTYVYDAKGNRTSESWYGGDTNPIGTTSTCSSAGGYTYKLVHTYTAGVRATSKYLKPGGADIGFYSLDTTVHGNSGLVSESRDTAGFRTKYTYDGLGRLTESEAVGDGAGLADNGARTSYSWTFSGGTGPNKVNIYRTCPTGVPGCTATSFGEMEYQYDGFGRTFFELVRRPEGMMKRKTNVNAMGWKTGITEWVPNGSSSYQWTTFANFDVYGRPQKINPPDGAAHDIDLSYDADRFVGRTVSVATSLDGSESTQTTNEFYDVFGRLVKVNEPGPGVTALYEYDEGNRLKHVDLVSNSGSHQHRYFTYDGRGFLTGETHPEKGSAGNSDVNFGGYDARGHAGYRWDTTATRGIDFDYDDAERLFEVRETTSGRLLKKFTYDSASGYGDGKLATATAWNYSPDTLLYPEVKVVESYSYNGRGGVISTKTTQFAENGVNTELHTQTFTWSHGAELTTETYPLCTGGVCAGAQPARTQTYGYAHGALTSVASWASAIGYHDSGMVASVTHTNGVVDTIEEDGYGRARPARMHSDLGAANLFDTGAMSYDGAGNIESMGASRFSYDAISRLTEAEISLNGGTYRQTYGLDPFGNIQSITTTPDGQIATTVPTPTSLGTNRLSSGAYDAGGNLTNWNANVYTFDLVNRMVRNQSGGEDWFYVYTVDDERVQMRSQTSGETWTTVRGLDGLLRRQMRNTTWSAPEDYIYRGGQLVGKSLGSGNQRHLHLDHLGTARRRTDPTGAVALQIDLYPYGEEIVPSSGNGERMRFTGHERDVLNTTSGSNFTADDLDYMHARHNSPITGRFLAVDKAPSWKPKRPQSWNRYTYARGNPMKFVDPTGLYVEVPDSMKAVVDNARAKSATFRRIFNLVNDNTRITVTLKPVTSMTSGKVGETGWSGTKTQTNLADGSRVWSGKTQSQILIGRTDAAIGGTIAHELQHSLELHTSKNGTIDETVPTARKGVGSTGKETNVNMETDAAIEIGEQTTEEIEGSQGAGGTAPTDIGQMLGESFFTFGSEAQQSCLSNVACISMTLGGGGTYEGMRH